MKTKVVFAEFGGKSSPDVGNVREFFRDADIQVHGPQDCGDLFEGQARWGNLMNDYWKVKKLLDADGYDVAIAMDADTRIVSDRVQAIFPLVKAFGLCLPANPRGLVAVDTEVGAGSDMRLDETQGMGHAFNMSPIAVDRSNFEAMEVLRVYCEILKATPVRGPLAMWRAAYHVGFFPCLLPVQWCVCGENVGCGNEVILHVGHDKVREFYGK